MAAPAEQLKPVASRQQLLGALNCSGCSGCIVQQSVIADFLSKQTHHIGACCLVLVQDSQITHVSDTIDLSAMPVEDAYTGPRMKGMGCSG